jgi:hypothetical protein
MTTTNAVALLLALFGPFVLVIGLDFVLRMAGRREETSYENSIVGRD